MWLPPLGTPQYQNPMHFSIDVSIGVTEGVKTLKTLKALKALKILKTLKSLMIFPRLLKL